MNGNAKKFLIIFLIALALFLISLFCELNRNPVHGQSSPPITPIVGTSLPSATPTFAYKNRLPLIRNDSLTPQPTGRPTPLRPNPTPTSR